MTVAPSTHIVFITGISWTHVRAGIKCSVRLTEKFPNIFISVYTFGPLASQSNAYLATQSKTARQRMRVVPSVVDSPIASPLDIVLNLEKGFKRWISEQTSTINFDAGEHAVTAPSWIIEDHINGGVGLGNGLPVTSFWAAPAASLLAHFSNADHGLGGRLLDSIGVALAKQKPGAEKSIEEVFRQELSHRVICIPGLPPFYEHEQIPQVLPAVLPLVTDLQKRWNKMRDEMDLVPTSGTYEMEPIAAQACAAAFTKPVRPLCIGPSVDLPPALPVEPDATSAFLDKAYAELGPHSVIYMAFGTVFFPLPESGRHLEILVEEIVERGLRLVFALSSEQAAMEEAFLQGLTKQGKAIFPRWTNQVNVIEHAAIHYVISHGGWNTTAETIVRDVPMLFWPFAGDQPTNAMQIATQHNCGFELMQVRTGSARDTAYPNTSIAGTDEAVREEMRNVLEMSKGARGRQQRMNVKALGWVIRKSVSEGGSGDVALREFGRLIGL